MMTNCYYCGVAINSDSIGVYQLVRGWERRRSGGGTNALRLAERAQRWACHACIEAQVKGYADNETLF